MCGNKGALIPSRTVEYQVVDSVDDIRWHIEIFSLCVDPECEMAYYSADFGYIFLQRDIRTELDYKSETKDKYVCYCQSIKYESVRKAVRNYGYKKARDFFKGGPPIIMEDCKKRNPFGCSCIADVQKIIDEIHNGVESEY
jgi:hypothetical protein